MPEKPTSQQRLLAENAELRTRLEQAEQTLSEIHSGQADALLIPGADGAQLFALQGADESYRTLVENMGEGALTVSMEGVILYANRSFAGMLKTPLEKVISSTLNSWIAPGSRGAFQALLSGDATNRRRAQLELAAGDGTRVPVSLSANTLQLGEMSEAFCLVAADMTEQVRSDKARAAEKLAQELLAAANQSRRELLSVIEDQKQAEESLRRLNEELENKVVSRTADLEQARQHADQSNRAKSDFLAAMSHEIRTPMNGVIGMLDVLKQSSLNSQQLEMVDIIHESAFTLLAVINDILDFSKIEAGKLQVERVPMNIASVVEGVCDSLDHMAIKKEVELTMYADPSLPTLVLGDPVRLRQILVNLANNAIKFSSGQGHQARVSVRAIQMSGCAPGKVTVEFCVSDNGIGIDAATQVRLFTPFTQADISTTRNFGGTGLGLAICLQLVKIKGGEISVQSEPGKGAVFTVSLPFDMAEEEAETDVPPSPVTGLHCLVAGDAGSIAGDLTAYLAHAGAIIEQATDLNAARQWIAVRQPGLYVVVIDTVGAELPLDDLYAASSAMTGVDVRFVIIRRGKRRQSRFETAQHVVLDAAVMHRKAFLEAVGIAAGRIEMQDLSILPGRVGKISVPQSREKARRQGRLILVAEDNEINQKVMQQQLALLGYAVDIADDGREALTLWQSGDYGILFTDLHMPEMDGYELTRSIRAAENGKFKTPIIAFTANALKGEAEHCREVGMDDYLSKPVQLANLKSMLEKWLPVAVAGVRRTASTVSGQALPAGKKHVGQSQACNPTPPVAGTPAPVNVNVLKALVGDDEETILEFLHDFRISADRIASELRSAHASGDVLLVSALAHKLKSPARSVGALALGKLCAGMEQAGKAGDTAALAALLPGFEHELAIVETYLDEY